MGQLLNSLGNFLNFTKESLRIHKYELTIAGTFVGLATWSILANELNHTTNYIANAFSDTSTRIECPADYQGLYQVGLKQKVFHPGDVTTMYVNTDQGDVITGGVYNLDKGSHEGMTSLFQKAVDDECGRITFDTNVWGDPSTNKHYEYGKHILFVHSEKYNIIHKLKILFMPHK